MMTRVLLTFLVGLLVSLGPLVSGVEPVLAKNWNTNLSPFEYDALPVRRVPTSFPEFGQEVE